MAPPTQIPARAIDNRGFAWATAQGLITVAAMAHVKNAPIAPRERAIATEERTQFHTAIKGGVQELPDRMV